MSVDEINIKLSIRYDGNSIVGFAVNTEEQRAAKSVLAILINPSMGAPPFVGRLFPVSCLKGVFLYEQIILMIKIIHDSGGFVYLVMSDDHSRNQNTYQLFHQNFSSTGIDSVNHPIVNEKLKKLYLMFDPVHLLKSIRNNWVTEKNQTLTFFDFAKWKDVIDIYKDDIQEEVLVKSTKLNRQSLWPNNFEKQKVYLVLNVFSEKVVARLEQKGNFGTATFIKFVLKMWQILNTSSVFTGNRLNNINMEAFRDKSDVRFSFLSNMATSFKLMDNEKRGSRVKGLTQETSKALHITINGMANVIQDLLEVGFTYVLPGTIQSDHLEKEFSIYRQSCGGNYFISFEEIIHSLNLERLKLFTKLEIDSKLERSNISVCQCQIDEIEIDDLIDSCFNDSSELSSNEKSTLYYISGYVSAKENLSSEGLSQELPESEFTELVSRGKLMHPPGDLYDLSQYFLAYFKKSNRKCCTKGFIKAFQMIYSMTGYDFPVIQSMIRRFVNCFFKAYVTKENEKIEIEKDARNTKRRRISSK